MLTRSNFENKLNKKDKICIIITVQLPKGIEAIETITNYNALEEKAKYLLNAYDNELSLKTKKEIKILDLIVICKDDLRTDNE